MRNDNDQSRSKLKVGLILGSFSIIITILLIDLGDNVPDGLSFFVLIGFVWLAFVEKKVKVAIISIVTYIMLTIFLMTQGWMHEHTVRNVTTVAILLLMTISVFQSKFLNIFVAVALLWGGALLLYFIDYHELVVSIGGLVAGGLGLLLGHLLIERNAKNI